MDIATKMLEDRPFITNFLEDSVVALARQRVLVEALLDEAKIRYSKEGFVSRFPCLHAHNPRTFFLWPWMPSNSNAGLFIWLDLSEFLYPYQQLEHGWAAEAALAAKLAAGGVVLSTGKRYQSPKPGNFRMIFSYNEATLREGIRR
jgi:1-aminocyclopropane-1-carboxylate synthase